MIRTRVRSPRPAGSASGDTAVGGTGRTVGPGDQPVAVGVDGAGEHPHHTAGGATPGLRIWDVASGRLRASPQEVAGVVALAISPDGKTIATGQSDGLVKLWDTTTWRSRIMLPAHREAITSLAISADNKLLATSSIDGSAKLWQIAGGKSALAAR